MELERGKYLIGKVQKKKALQSEESELYNEFVSRYRPHKRENYLYDQDELKTEFLLGCWNAVFKAKLNVGDPIMYCVHRGNMAMIDYYRKVSSEKLILICTKCGHTMAYDRRNKSCHKCGCPDLISREKEIIVDFGVYSPDKKHMDGIVEEINFEDTITEIIRFLKTVEKLGIMHKQMAIDALKTKTDFYEYARQTGKSHSWSISFKKKIIDMLHPVKDKFLMVI